MGQSAFKIDGASYNISIINLTRKAIIKDGKNAGNVMSGEYVRDVVGTYYNYTITIGTKNLDAVEYDNLFEVLSAPVDFHSVEMPYGQGVITFDAYITDVSDELRRMRDEGNLWANLDITFYAKSPRGTPHEE